MKTRCTTQVLVLMAAALLLPAATFAKDDSREAALKAAELARFAANVDADAKALDLLLDDGLDYLHSNGDVDTKASFIESLVSGKRDYVSTTANIQSVRILGDIAIIRGTAKVTVADNGQSRDLDLGYTDVWVWKDKRWQMTAWRSARYPAPTPAADTRNEASARTTIRARFEAALRGDTAALEKILGDDLDYCNFRGECESKRQYIGEIASGALKYKSIEHTVERVKMFADTAVVSGRVQATATRDGVERSINAYFLAVLAWRDNRWQFSSWASTLIEPPPAK